MYGRNLVVDNNQALRRWCKFNRCNGDVTHSQFNMKLTSTMINNLRNADRHYLFRLTLATLLICQPRCGLIAQYPQPKSPSRS